MEQLNIALETNDNLDSGPTVIKSKRGRKPKKDLSNMSEEDKNKELKEKEDKEKEKEKKPRKPRETKEAKEARLLASIISDSSKNNININKNELKENVEMDENGDIRDDISEDLTIDDKPTDEHKKKRGRKPKGGKIIQQTNLNNIQVEQKTNIILHLKCNLNDIDNYSTIENNKTQVNAYNNESYTDMCIPINQTYITDEFDTDVNDVNVNDRDATKEIWRKLKQLEHNLHTNSIVKKSACLWDSFDFDNPPIYIPKHFINGTYEVYGCFCSPECAAAHLMNQHIDKSAKFERYHMLNHIYAKIYGFNKNIKPAGDPHYMLEKFLGNLTIQEYRSLLRTERLFLVIDKPLTKVFPELHEDNDDFILNNKIIPSNTYQIKGKMQRKRATKNSMLEENFGMNA